MSISKAVYIDDTQRDLIHTALDHFYRGLQSGDSCTNHLALLTASSFTKRRIKETIKLFETAIDTTVDKP